MKIAEPKIPLSFTEIVLLPTLMYDVVARLAVDEFVVLIEKLDSLDDIRLLTQAILNSVNSPLTITGHTIQVGASIGISLFPRNGTSAEELVLGADEAMYRTKSSGRHTFDLCF